MLGLSWRGIVDLAPSAFLASAHLARPLIYTLLLPIVLARFDATVLKTIDHSPSLCKLPPPCPSLQCIQRAWDDGVCSANVQLLLNSSSGADRARIMAYGSPNFRAWLYALPSSNLGLCLPNEDLTQSPALRNTSQRATSIR